MNKKTEKWSECKNIRGFWISWSNLL